MNCEAITAEQHPATQYSQAINPAWLPFCNVSRSRYTEDALEAEIRQGVEQYVILGAELDTFAFRRKEMLEEVKVFEVDLQSTQQFKRGQLAALETLLESPYDPKVRSLFSWLGVTMYLSLKDVLETLRSITQIAPKGSSVIFDYHTEVDVNLDEIRKELQRMDESMLTTFDPSILAIELKKLGFDLHEDLEPADIQQKG
ncbi:class I SAM-dependent methyltransferase [Ferviditalea candida]|uniref:Class I SAM-dependent methyltransferase n=1 Tax=Ferviditalea candida TaxID=3108399 RepID=A0ABU5ZG54_9BACL|nr:class I SAM-dependent methyltransferase [Paenibacillaceae bacterium T2]